MGYYCPHLTMEETRYSFLGVPSGRGSREHLAHYLCRALLLGGCQPREGCVAGHLALLWSFQKHLILDPPFWSGKNIYILGRNSPSLGSLIEQLKKYLLDAWTVFTCHSYCQCQVELAGGKQLCKKHPHCWTPQEAAARPVRTHT